MVAPFKTRLHGHWDLFDELHRELGRFFGEPLAQVVQGGNRPSLNMAGDEDRLVLVMDLPGVKPADLEITVEGRDCKISASRELPLEGDETWVTRQRPQGTFEQSVDLPYEVETDKVVARLEHGVLRVELPRLESSKPRKIKIN